MRRFADKLIYAGSFVFLMCLCVALFVLIVRAWA